MKLISMTDFVLEHKHMILSNSDKYIRISKYAKFLKQPLTLGMFVPCDEVGNVLEEPIDTIGGVERYSEKYEQAKERVLFDIPNLDDLETIKKCIKGETIELLTDGTVTLTQSALKQIGL